ncbi:MAG: GNAT family N-acetyltransferase [Paludibacteraceae bacterium]|nr:GNAT family N-acetyltransferase [Paludibacteraceae bacterium]
MTNKELYLQFCQKHSSMPIFMQPWWLDAVGAGKAWDVIIVTSENIQLSTPDSTESEDILNDDIVFTEDNKIVVAVMPYLIRKKWWMTYILMPQETQLGGVWISPSFSSYAEQISQYVAQELQAMKLHYYYQHYCIDNPCPSYLESLGFKIKKHTTYRIEELEDLDSVIKRFSKNQKRNLQKALSLHAEHDSLSAEQFYRFHTDCLKARRRNISYTREFLLVLYIKAQRLNQCQVLSIHNADGEVYAAAFLVWDSQCMYYLIPCFAFEHKDSGASSLLVLEAIKLAREKGVAFDFEGSNKRNIAKFYKQFGSKPKTYFSVKKYYRPLFVFAMLYNRIKNLAYKL